MNARPDTSAEPLWVVPVGIAVVSAFCLWQIYRFNFLSDDAFITFRYARNLADGYGFVFNPGQRVEGSTSTLWTFMLAGMHAVTALDIVATARLFGALFGVAVVIETWRLARVSSPAGHPLVQLLAPAILIGSPSFAAWAAAGLETALFTYLVTALMRATLEGRRWASAVVASLAVLTRPEGLVPAAILVGYWLWEDRGRRVPVTLRQIGLITAVCAGVFIVRFVYFGDWLPNTYYVKAGGESPRGNEASSTPWTTPATAVA